MLASVGAEIACPSTAAQREIFSASMSDPAASRGYNHSISIFLEGSLDRDALYSALIELQHRHEALRGRFTRDGNTFLVRERIAFELPLTDLRGLGHGARQLEYERLVRDELDHVFDLIDGPLFRAALVRRDERDWVLVLNCHHAVVDGWSLKIILAELPHLYSDGVAGCDTSTLPASASFVAYLKTVVARERDRADSVRAYWREQFRDGVPALDLPLDNPRPRMRTYESLREDYRLDRRIYAQLKAVGAERGVSQFVTLLSAFALYVSRISGQHEVVIGVPAAGQISSGERALLGHDARVMPIRCVCEPGDTFARFASRVLQQFIAAVVNQWITIPELIEAVDSGTERTWAPLLGVMFNFDPGPENDALSFAGLKSRRFFNHRNCETFELSVNAVVEGGELVLEWAYNRSLFDAAEMHLRLKQFEQLLSSIVATPDAPLERLSLVPPEQAAVMNAVLNSSALEYEANLCVDQLLERSVLATPDKVAVQCAAQTLSYSQLWARSGAVAQQLSDQHLGAIPLVGVMLERSADLVAVLLGVWRAGAAFVPLDPAYPPERLDYMIQHSGMRVLLSERRVERRAHPGVAVIDIEDIPAAQAISFRATRRPDDLAYVIYTSGSTGKPKGVQVEHRALVNFLTSMRTRAPGITADDRLLAVTTLSFDIAELELWLPLVAGGTVVVAERSTIVDGLALVQLLRAAQITMLQATPSMWRMLLLAGWDSERRLTAICGGEALPEELAEDLLPRVGMLWNAYGPTETTVWSCIDRVTANAVTIGGPIGNTQAYVLDAFKAWVPRGSVGELWIGGAGVSRGYLGHDDLTHERFVPNSFSGAGAMYRTGDLVRLRRDGRLEYVGRNDFQVKVRGFRIELGEVQLALSRLPKIRQCVVAVREKERGDAHLVAFYTLHDGEQTSAQELRASVAAVLPDYMVPGWFVELPRLPLTQNGKIDLKALPDPFRASTAVTPELARAEELLAEHPAVAAIALLFPNERDRDTRPVAFLAAQGAARPDAVTLRKHVRGRCAEGLIPEKIVLLPALPLTRKGVVDRERLAELMPGAPVTPQTGEGGSDWPRTEAETILAAAWRDILKVARVGTNDNFFDLGGHSLLSIQMIARVERETGFRLVPRHVLLDTLGQLARRLNDGRHQASGE